MSDGNRNQPPLRTRVSDRKSPETLEAAFPCLALAVGVDLDANGAISFGEWQTAWEGSAEVRAMFDGTELIRSSASAAVRRD
eukprot:721874-Pleurochrysis_carterae.AAC.3